MLRLYDTAFGEVRELDLREPGKVSMYVCGPTVYADPHIGHGRFAVIWDVVRRYLEWSGYDVAYVSNITDIEDKIIGQANADGVSTDDIVRTYEKSWWDAMDGLDILPPDSVPHATEYVEQMVDYIAGLVDSSAAYETSDGVYFAIDTVADYGRLARQSLDSLRAGAGGRELVGEDKHNPLDFALWKKAKPGEPSWPSPWGLGRPGWHIECTVMALDKLGDDFDLHGGGIDLAFPHHENERAQAVGGRHRFARHWVHNGMVTMGAEKMSKSIGNTISLTGLLDRYDGRAYRVRILQAHYRSPVEITFDTMDQAAATVERLDAFDRATASMPNDAKDDAALDRFRQFMDDDLNTPRAVAVLFDCVAEGFKGDAPAAAAARDMCVALGIELRGTGVAIDDETRSKMDERDEARRRKDFARADGLRAELQAMGWVVEDGPQGTTVHR